jgi:mannosyltransferase
MHVDEVRPEGGTLLTGSSLGSAEQRRWTTPLLLLAATTAFGFALRFWHLGQWTFQATEMFTLRDSNSPQFRNPRPLGYLLNYFLVRPVLPLDEFGLRLLPAIFGVLAIPAMYYVTRRLVGRRPAIIAALLVAVSPLLIMYSQLARYWSLVFLLCIIYPILIYLGLRDQRRRDLVLGIVTGILAALAHPVSVILVGGPLLLVLVRLRPAHAVQLWSNQAARWAIILLALLGVAALIRMIPILHGWISQHDKHPGSGQFLLRPQPPPGLKQLLNMAAFVESLTVPVAVLGVVGLYLLWRERNQVLALFLASLAVFPLVFLSLVSLRTPISQYYLLPAVPVFFIGAGIFVDRLFDLDLRPRWLLPVTTILLVVAAGAPTLISDLRDGRRFDFRAAARWLDKQLRPGDIVFSDQPMVLDYYLRGAPVERLRRPEALDEAMQRLSPAEDQALWVIAPAPSHAFRANLKRGGLIFWMYDHCQLRTSVGVGRIDLRQDYLQVYRCPPLAPPPPGSQNRAGTRSG